MSETVATAKSQPRRRPWLWTVVGLCLVALAGGGWWVGVRQPIQRTLALLSSPLSSDRSLGAHLTARERPAEALAILRTRLLEDAEENANVREAYVYALGRAGSEDAAPALEHVVETDPSPFVQQAAWVALARAAKEQFRVLAANVLPSTEPWVQIGLAHGWLIVHDARGVQTLLKWAAEGDDEQRRVASMALLQQVAPLLEIAGRWPLDAEIMPNAAWSPALVAEVGRRCGELDLQRIIDDTLPYLGRAESVQRQVGRVTHARGYLAKLIGGG